jgi:hypothetical protein
MSRAISDASTMSPEAATTKLAEMRAAYRPQRETQAADKLHGLLKNEALMRSIDRGGAHGGSDGIALPGGPAFDQIQGTVADFHAERGSIVDLALAGHVSDINDSGYLQMKNTVDVLRADGIADGAIRQLIGNEPVSRAEYDRVAQWKREAMENPLFIAAYLKGSPPEVRMMTNASIVLVSPIKEEGAA